ncbi:MAG: ankyrin repeat domain-containing protein [Terracidiphilus sp.]
MMMLKATRPLKQSLILGILVVLACVVASTRANAQGDDLINAAKSGDLPRVTTLLASGINVDAKSSKGATALFVASYYGHLDVVQALLAKGADVNARSNGATALYIASQEGQLEVVQALLAKGADVTAKLSDGRTALDAAKGGGHVEVRAILEKPFAEASEKQDWDQAVLKDTVQAYLAFSKAHPDSKFIKKVTGTLRGRYWKQTINPGPINNPAQIGDVGPGHDGVVVTVEGMNVAKNLSLEDAKSLGVIGVAPASEGANSNADGMMFNYIYFEATKGGVIVGHQMITPKDSLNSTILLSADSSRLLAWDLTNATAAANPSSQPTMKEGPDGKYPCGLACPNLAK